MMKKAPVVVALVIAAVSVSFVSAQAEPLDEQRIERIRQQCSSAQGTLQRIQRSDAATRINRGRAYESLLKQLAAFNSRVVLNKFDIPVLASATTDIEATFTAFQKDYIAYDDLISDTININCQEQPVTFYDSLSDTRTARSVLTADIKRIDGLLNSYQAGLDGLGKELTSGDDS